jgi:hypothetical protein
MQPTRRVASGTAIHPKAKAADQKLIDATLIRTSGANDFAWLDELVD